MAQISHLSLLSKMHQLCKPNNASLKIHNQFKDCHNYLGSIKIILKNHCTLSQVQLNLKGRQVRNEGVCSQYNQMMMTSSSKESNFTTVVGLAAEHLLSPLADRCYPAYQLQRPTEFFSLQGFHQNLGLMSPLHSVVLGFFLFPLKCTLPLPLF